VQGEPAFRRRHLHRVPHQHAADVHTGGRPVRGDHGGRHCGGQLDGQRTGTSASQRDQARIDNRHKSDQGRAERTRSRRAAGDADGIHAYRDHNNNHSV